MESKLLEKIKEIYVQTGKPLTLMQVYSIGRKILGSDNKIRREIKYLVNSGKLILKNQIVIPVISEEEKNFFKERENPITEDKVMEILKDLKLAKPTEIFYEYVKRYGKVNPESLTRFVRKLWFEGKLDREGEKYFIPNLVSRSNLMFYG